MDHPALKTPLCRMLGIEYPIIQAGMGFVARGELTGAVSAAGGMGTIGAGTMSAAPGAVNSGMAGKPEPGKAVSTPMAPKALVLICSRRGVREALFRPDLARSGTQAI